MHSRSWRWVLGFCPVVALAASCGSSDGKKGVSIDGEGGVGGETEPSGGQATAGTNTSGRPQGGAGGAMNGGTSTGGSLNDGGALGEGAAPGLGGAGGEGAASGLGGAGGEAATSGAAGSGGEGGASASCCKTQVDYSATSGVLPSDDLCTPWTLVDNAEPEVPTFGGGALRVSSSAVAENMYFHQSGIALAFPAQFVFEARMKLISSASTSPSRAAGSMTFVYGAQRMKNMVQMSATEVFILSGENTKGTSIPFDTTTDFHTYRIVVDTQANTFQLFIDDELEISGATFTANSVETVQFGETSNFAYGASEWQFARHNAFSCPSREP